MSVAKGLFFINDGTEYSNEKLVEYYGLSDRGIATGYVLFNDLGLTNYIDDNVVIIYYQNLFEQHLVHNNI